MAKELLKIIGAERVNDFGTAGARRLIRAGKIPCVVYGQRAPFHFTVDAQVFAALRKKLTKTTPIDVVVADRDMTCLLKSIQEDLLKDKVLHLDFYELDRNKEVNAKVKLVLTGTPKGVKDGGVLEQVMYEVEVVCLPKDLPQNISVDVSNLAANESIALKDITHLSGVTFKHDSSSVVATVKYEKGDDTPVAAAPADAAAPAAAKTDAPAKDAKASK